MNNNLKSFELSWIDKFNSVNYEYIYSESWTEALCIATDYVREHSLDIDCCGIVFADRNGNTHKFHSLREEREEQEAFITEAKAHLGKALSEVEMACDCCEVLGEKKLPTKAIANDVANLCKDIKAFYEKLLNLACEAEYIQNKF